MTGPSLPTPQVSASAPIFLLSLLLSLCACRPPVLPAGDRPASKAPRSDRLHEDPDFPCQTFTHARSYTLRSRLEPGAVGSFADLTPARRQALEQLMLPARQAMEVLMAEGRVLITLPPEHPWGAMELLLVEDRDLLVVFAREGRRRLVLRRERLPDLLEGLGPTVRTRHTLKVEPLERPPVAAGPGADHARRHLRTRGARAVVGLHLAPEHQREDGALRLRITLDMTLPDDPVRIPFDDTLLDMALPLLQDAEGSQLREGLAAGLGLPLMGWTTRVVALGGDASDPPAIRTELLDHGQVKTPLCRFSVVRHEYRDSTAPLVPAVSGQQLVPQAALAGLRPGKTAGPLKLENRSPAFAFIHVDGAPVAWVAPRKRLAVKGLAAGFYRVYATSPLGIRTWGPHDMYVPGPLTLR